MSAVLHRRYPCCGRPVKAAAIGPELVERRCPQCGTRWRVRRAPALVSDRPGFVAVEALRWEPAP